MILTDLSELARIVADWAAPAAAVEVYIFGSRVRGDHSPDSDVDIYIHYRTDLGVDDETVAWHDRQQSSSYADLCPLLPGPLGGNGRQTLCPGDVLVRSVLAGKVIYTDRSVRCVLLPKKRSARA